MSDFDEILESMAGHQQVKPAQARLLSGLGSREVERLVAVWPALADAERLNLLATLRRLAESDVLLDFDAVYEMAMDDPNADVRRLAIMGSLDDERPGTLARLLHLCGSDPDEMVRWAAADRLSGFAYSAEVGKLPEESGREIEEVLLGRVQSETEGTAVRAAALASVGYLSTEPVRAEIRRALTREGLRISAIRAIGHNCDPIWTGELIQQMGSPEASVRREAAVAAADYEGTVGTLADLVDDSDTSVRMAAIASLGKIGGPEAREVLVYCYESQDPDIRHAAAKAMRQMEETEDPLGTVGVDWEEDSS